MVQNRNDLAVKRLGTYLLQGWVMTDKVCQKDGCGDVPLMRSKDGSVWHCVLCDEKENNINNNNNSIQKPTSPLKKSTTTTTSSSNSFENNKNTMDRQQQNQEFYDDDVAYDDYYEPFVPIVDEETRKKRREQSDKATKLIGEKMLRGWALLGDQCPKPTCYGIPLVANRDKQEFCVICDSFIKKVTPEEFETMNISLEKQSETSAMPVVAVKNVSRQIKENEEPALKKPKVAEESSSSLPSFNQENVSSTTTYDIQEIDEQVQTKQQQITAKEAMPSAMTTPSSSNTTMTVQNPKLNTIPSMMTSEYQTELYDANAALWHTYSQLKSQLNSSHPTSIDAIAKICDAMNKCAQAIQSCQSLQGH